MFYCRPTSQHPPGLMATSEQRIWCLCKNQLSTGAAEVAEVYHMTNSNLPSYFDWTCTSRLGRLERSLGICCIHICFYSQDPCCAAKYRRKWNDRLYLLYKGESSRRVAWSLRTQMFYTLAWRTQGSCHILIRWSTGARCYSLYCLSGTRAEVSQQVQLRNPNASEEGARVAYMLLIRSLNFKRIRLGTL